MRQLSPTTPSAAKKNGNCSRESSKGNIRTPGEVGPAGISVVGRLRTAGRRCLRVGGFGTYIVRRVSPAPLSDGAPAGNNRQHNVTRVPAPPWQSPTGTRRPCPRRRVCPTRNRRPGDASRSFLHRGAGECIEPGPISPESPPRPDWPAGIRLTRWHGRLSWDVHGQPALCPSDTTLKTLLGLW